MAKSDKSLDKINMSRSFTPPRSGNWAGDTPINGFDTETKDGDIFMLSIAWDGFGGKVYHNDGEKLEPETLLKVFTHNKARSGLNVWYNLDFDVNVFLKGILNRKQLAELTVSGSTETEDYEIIYIKSKFLKINDQHNHNYIHYDVAQFFFTSLENAVNEWLELSKADETFEAALFGSNSESQLTELIEDSQIETWESIGKQQGDRWNLGDAGEYIDNNWKDILKYARKDAVLVRDLWKKAVSVGEKLEIPMGRPFSTGYLAESYLNEHMKEKPGIGPRPMSKLAWDSYAGGRFEVIKVGNIGPVVGPDINSAYPYQLSKLPDPKTLVWRQTQNPSINELENADYGFIRANVVTDSNRPIQPFAVKHEEQDKLVYPALEGQSITTLKDIFIFAHTNDYLKDYYIGDCWLGYETEATWFPFKFVRDLYKDRMAAKAQKQFQRELWLKIILNSMYGKTCQTTPKRQRVSETIELDDHQEYISDLSLPKGLRENYRDGIVESLESGAWFNPFLATYITGLTRLELHKRIIEYGLEYNTVMLATDCLMVEKEAFDTTTFKGDLVKDGLGNWDMDYTGKAFVIGAGVYQIDFENGDMKVKTRGFNEADLTGGLKNAAKEANGQIEVRSNRPRTVAEVIWRNDSIKDVGKFLEHPRQIKPDMDTKRNWENPITFGTLLDGTQISEPITL